ncbi:lipopolysaccharide assembly protein LapB [Aureispira sp. CCB-QB1]|uniref:tetratricopeptide repeat protein n=1 Tax=Aureispira sp. CCB-QB1 TaxID=1313421 RepID=UPI000696160B|nr:hypothetical protein [Aureispira sp. CCB-QB1]
MNLKITLYSILFGLFVSCTNNNTTSTEQLQVQLDKAIGYNDYYTAIYYAHELLAINPNLDSTAIQLAELYKVTKNYAGAIKVAEELIPKVTLEEQLVLWTLKAESLTASRNYPEAIAAYNVLKGLDKTKALEYLYEIGVLYFQARDIQNGIQTMEQVRDLPASKTTLTKIHSDWGEDNVSYYLAALNYIGYIKIETNDFDAATAIYDEITRLGVPFKLAAGNKKLLEQLKASTAKK